jgi:hypothetical protein
VLLGRGPYRDTHGIGCPYGSGSFNLGYAFTCADLGTVNTGYDERSIG